MKRRHPSFPSHEKALEAVRTLIKFIGDDPDRSGLKGTPERVLRAWLNDWGLSYHPQYLLEQKRSIVKAQFDDHENYDQMICQRGIGFTSFCEHHMCPFSGTIDIGYIPSPNGKVLGLSKLVRITELFTHKLQVQERITNQIAQFIWDEIKPLGVGVVIKATHTCMTSRGVKQHDSDAVTQALRGEMLTKPEVRAEFMSLTKGKK